jgi:CRP/FNR family transcriptional regulator
MIDFHSLQHCQSCRVQEHLFLNHLTSEQRQQLNGISFRISLPSASTIFREGDAADGVRVLRKGRVKIVMNSEEGRTVLLYIAAPGELLGLSSAISGDARKISAVALEACDLDMIRRDAFLDFLNQHEAESRAALEELSAQHSCILDAIRRLSLAPSLLANLARILLGLNCPEEGPQSDTIHLRLTHEEIAQQLGATRESITRSFSKLRRNNIIEQRGQSIFIREPGVLEHLASTRVKETALQPV